MTATMPQPLPQILPSMMHAPTPEAKWPIAECFKSPQGEATFAGTYMAFIRFAGCNVGKPYTEQERLFLGTKIYQEQCCSILGENFSCDTNYKMAMKMGVAELMAFVGDTEHVCLTGGEPLMHDLSTLVVALLQAGKMVHIETSGTKSAGKVLSAAVPYGTWKVWITVSPKLGCTLEMLDVADELKVLVGDKFDEALFVQKFAGRFHKTWIQPIGEEHSLIPENIKRCVLLQEKYPDLKISIQCHKILGVR